MTLSPKVFFRKNRRMYCHNVLEMMDFLHHMQQQKLPLILQFGGMKNLSWNRILAATALSRNSDPPQSKTETYQLFFNKIATRDPLHDPCQQYIHRHSFNQLYGNLQLIDSIDT
jgi:hypothetical protein